MPVRLDISGRFGPPAAPSLPSRSFIDGWGAVRRSLRFGWDRWLAKAFLDAVALVLVNDGGEGLGACRGPADTSPLDSRVGAGMKSKETAAA
jgi:hypothetical protein